jgi:nucleoside permease NupC
MIGLLGIVTMLALAVLISERRSAIEIAPERGAEVAKLGLRAVLAGTLANFLSASIVSGIIAMQG